MYAAQCTWCGGYTILEQSMECSRCGSNQEPACGNCLHPISLSAGMCLNCGEEPREIVLIQRTKDKV